MKTFNEPPLIELIAEVRWSPVGVPPGAAVPGNVAAFDPSAFDSLFMRFAGLIGAKGFTQSERLVPPGFPSLLYQATYRYSRNGVEPGQALFQLGPGIFSTHITPPYKRWSDFAPFLEDGIEALVSVRKATEKEPTFDRSMVRYLDCFTTRYTQGRDPRSFIKDALGITVGLPDAIERRARSGNDISPTLQLSFPLGVGKVMNFRAGAGKVGKHAGVVVDSSVVTTAKFSANLGSILSALDEAHRVLSDSFVEITAPIHHLMGARDE